MLNLTANNGMRMLIPAHRIQEITLQERQTRVHLKDGTVFPVQERAVDLREQLRRAAVISD